MPEQTFFVPTKGTDSWKHLLADPKKQWKDNFSAKMLAECWEGVNDFPKSWKQPLYDAKLEIELVFGFPEFKVALDQFGRASQNDLFVVARDNSESYCIAVEGKVKEDFGPTIQAWYQDPSDNKKERLKGLLNRLNLDPNPNQHFTQRYQLYHRTVSALLMAERLHSKNAMMVVHSFSQTDAHLEDFNDFIGLLEPGLKIKANEIKRVSTLFNGIRLWVGWVSERPELFK